MRAHAMVGRSQANLESDRLLVLVVFFGAAAHFIRGVTALVCGDFRRSGRQQVKSQLVGETHEVDENVGGLSADAFELFRRGGAALCRGQPLEFRGELAGLGDECRGKIFRRVKLLPVALGRELPQAQGQVG
jgi:hypothetical protein